MGKPEFPIGPDEELGETCDGEAQCPHCGYSWGELWDYEWGNHDELTIDCPRCRKPLVLICRRTVEYSTTHIPVPIDPKDPPHA